MKKIKIVKIKSLNDKYRLYPNKEQESKLNQQFFVANQSWNQALSIRIAEIKKKNQKIIEKIYDI